MNRLHLRRWWLKAAAQGGLSLLPGAPRLEERVRHWRSGRHLDEDYFLSKWHHVSWHTWARTGHASGDLRGVRVVELGTGWFPIVPLGLALRGAEVVTVDANAHLDRGRLRLVLDLALELVARGVIEAPHTELLQTVRDLAPQTAHRPVTETLRSLGITAHLADARDLSELDRTHGAHLMVSNNTLEHIPPDVLAGIFAEFARVAAPGARMSHYIDLADHYAGVDPKIGEFNFLTLRDWQWRLANNRLHYQNRLRISDYKDILTQTGWQVLRARNNRRPKAEVEALELMPPFDQVPVKQLRVVKSHLVAALAATPQETGP